MFEDGQIEKIFAKHLTAWINKNKVKVKDIAKGAKVDPSYVSNIKAGRRNARENQRRNIAKHINVPYDQMIGIDNGVDPEQNLNEEADMIIELRKVD